MTRARAFALAITAFLSVAVVPVCFAVEDGRDAAVKPVGGGAHAASIGALSATLYFSGNISYSVGGGMATVSAADVANTGTQPTGPLRFSLWWTPNAPFPAAGSNTARTVSVRSIPGSTSRM